MRMESKSLIALPRSNGLERYKFPPAGSSLSRPALSSRLLLISLHLSRLGTARYRCSNLAASRLNWKRKTGTAC